MENKSIEIGGFVISALVIGGLIYAFIKHTKLVLLILLGLVLLCVGIGIFIACYERFGPGFKSVSEQKLQKRLEDLILRIKRSRRFSASAKDALANSYSEQLLQIAESLLKTVKDTPDSPQKAEIITRKTDELEHAIEKLEQLNLTTAAMDAGQIHALEEDFQITIDAMQAAEASVAGSDAQNQFYSAQQ